MFDIEQFLNELNSKYALFVKELEDIHDLYIQTGKFYCSYIIKETGLDIEFPYVMKFFCSCSIDDRYYLSQFITALEKSINDFILDYINITGLPKCRIDTDGSYIYITIRVKDLPIRSKQDLNSLVHEILLRIGSRMSEPYIKGHSIGHSELSRCNKLCTYSNIEPIVLHYLSYILDYLMEEKYEPNVNQLYTLGINSDGIRSNFKLYPKDRNKPYLKILIEDEGFTAKRSKLVRNKKNNRTLTDDLEINNLKSLVLKGVTKQMNRVSRQRRFVRESIDMSKLDKLRKWYDIYTSPQDIIQCQLDMGLMDEEECWKKGEQIAAGYPNILAAIGFVKPSVSNELWDRVEQLEKDYFAYSVDELIIDEDGVNCFTYGGPDTRMLCDSLDSIIEMWEEAERSLSRTESYKRKSVKSMFESLSTSDKKRVIRMMEKLSNEKK